VSAGSFGLPAQIRTERLILRAWNLDEDLEPLTELYTQPEYLAHMPALDRAGTRAQIEKLIRNWQQDGFSQWAAVDAASMRLIGRIGLLRHHDWPLAADPVEVGWVLHREFQGRGLATEGGRASVEAWRKYLPEDRRLLSITVPDNVRSRRVMDRLGLVHRGEAYWRGLDVVWYALDRPEA
jgi:RimJ/RimL family protein N-acetyltransferase